MNKLFNMKDARQNDLQHRLGGGRRRKGNTVKLGIKMAPTDKSPTCQFSISPDVLDKLHWKVADKVNILLNDETCIIERDNGGYWRVGKDGGSKNFLISFTPLAGKYTATKETVSRATKEFRVDQDRLIVAW